MTKGVKTRIRGGNKRKGGRDNARKGGNTKNQVKYEGGGGGTHHLRCGSGHRQPPTTPLHPHSTPSRTVIGWPFSDVWRSSAVVTWCTQVLLVVSLVVGSSAAVTCCLGVVGGSDVA